MSAQVTYKTHILVGVRPNGIMTVIADGRTSRNRQRSRRKSSKCETGTPRLRCARRRLSWLRTAMPGTPGVTHGTDAGSEAVSMGGQKAIHVAAGMIGSCGRMAVANSATIRRARKQKLARKRGFELVVPDDNGRYDVRARGRDGLHFCSGAEAACAVHCA